MAYRKRGEGGKPADAGAGGDKKEDGRTLYNLLAAEQERARARADAGSWYVPDAASEDGKSEKVWVRMPPVMVKAVSYLIESKRTPYLTISDFIRSACYIHAIYCYQAAELPRTPLSAVQLMNQATQELQAQAALERAIHHLSQAIQEAVDAGDVEDARGRLAGLWGKLEQFPDNAWKKRISGQIQRKYSALAGGGGGLERVK